MIYKYKRDNESSESHVAQCSKVGAIWLISKFANIFTKEMASLNREEPDIIFVKFFTPAQFQDFENLPEKSA